MGFIKGPILPLLKDKSKKHDYLLTSEIKFDAAHRLSNYKGKCSQIHGHTYRVIVTIKSNKLNSWGAIMDFGELKKILKTHIGDKYDHKTILMFKDNENQIIGRVLNKDGIVWTSSNPTAENMARDIWNDLIPVFNIIINIKLVKVTVYETATNAATYQNEK